MERYPWDSVNLFNGNLNISVPLGINYPIAGEFGYRFFITYNSNVWDLDQTAGTITANPMKCSNAGLGWDLSFGRLIAPVVNGSKVGPWVYVSPDGNLHPFYSTLHYDLSEADPQDVCMYTRDGSYYRLYSYNESTRFVEAPDGTQSVFQLTNGEWKLIQVGDRFDNRIWFTYSTPNVWMITDNRGRTHTVYFKADVAGYYPAIIDRIVLAAFNGTTATYTFNYTVASVTRPSIDSGSATRAMVNLPLLTGITAPDGSQQVFTYTPTDAPVNSSGRLASMRLATMGRIEWTYQNYSYTTSGNPTALGPILSQTTGVASRKLINIGGGVEGTWTYTPSLRPAGTQEREMTNTVQTPLGDKTVYYFSVDTTSSGPEWNKSDYGLPLTKDQFDRPRAATNNVALAANGAVASASSSVNSSYPASATINGDRKGLNWGNGGGWEDGTTNFFPDWLQVDFSASKTIDRINIFTAQDDYANPVDPTPDLTFDSQGIKDFDVQYWNGAGWVTVPGGSVVGNTLVWRQFMFAPLTTSKIRVVVNKANMSSRIAEVEAFESVLPADTRFLSKQIFDCDAAGGNCQLMRSTYVRYEQDQATDPASAEVANVNRREASNRIVYHDDVENGVARFADTDKSNFDGLGHYRQIETNGNFGSGDVKTRFLNYDAATGNYPSAGYAMPSPSTPWILNTFSQQKITEITQTASAQIMEFCFDRTNGFLKRVRRLSTTNPVGTASSNDVVIVYTPDTFGQIAMEQYYGGDVQLIGTGSLCNLALPSSDQYQIRNTYSFGVQSGAGYYTESGTMAGPKFLDRDIDQNTGLVAAARDKAGIATAYEYDAMGRQTWIKPQLGHGAWQQFNYVAAIPTDYAKKLIYDKSNGGGTLLTYNAEVYDSFGRLWWEQTTVPGSYPNRYKFYNAMGWVTQTSEFSNDAPKYTQYLNYDPFGRPKLIRPSDGAQHDVTFEYAGVRSIKKTAQFGTLYNNNLVYERPRIFTELFDRQGRPWKTIYNWTYNAPRPDTVTVSYYDVADHLTQKTVNDRPSSFLYAYDGRGFMYYVNSGNSQVDLYQQLDAWGNAHKRRHSAAPDLAYLYDRAGRVTRVQELNNPSKVWKEFTYADTNGANDWRAGKLWMAKRYNYMPTGSQPYVVTESYTYGGTGGRLSRYEIELANSLFQPERFAQTYTYDDLGNVKELGYPNSIAAGSGSMGRDRTITNNYTAGYLTSLTGVLNGQAESWAAEINYHPNGLVKLIAHSNGVSDNIATDPNGFVRVASVSTSGVKRFYPQIDDNLNTGDFFYDGSGNLVRVGNSSGLPSADPASYEPSPPAPSAPATAYCQNTWSDPLGMVYASSIGGDCAPVYQYFYNAADKPVRVDEGIGNGTRMWYFHDPSGHLLTTYKRGVWSHAWVSTTDYIYRDKSLFAIQEATPGSASTTRHIHQGFGTVGIETDQNGYKIRE